MTQDPGAAAHPALYWLLIFLLFCVGLRWFEGAMLYHPGREISAHPGSYGLAYEDLNLRAPDGPLINGWYVENKPDSPVILLCHGNAGTMSNRLDKLVKFRKAGASVLLFDYRGYGRSKGVPTEAGTYRDAELFYRWLIEIKKVPPSRIVLYGESLGNGVAIEMALRHKPLGLIVDSAFTSTVDMGRLVLPWLPVDWIVKYRYDNLAKIPKISSPVLVMHSRQDDVIPFAMGQALFAAAPQPKIFLEMQGSHNDGFMDTGPAYDEAVERFLKSLPSD